MSLAAFGKLCTAHAPLCKQHLRSLPTKQQWSCARSICSLKRHLIPYQKNNRAQRALVHGSATAASQETTQEVGLEAEASTFKAHIEWKAIRDNLEQVKTNVANRNSSADPEKVVHLYEQWRELQTKAEAIRTDRNANAKSMKGKMEAEVRQKLVEEGKKLKEQLAELEVELDDMEAALQTEGQKLPNFSHPDAPVGGEEDAAVLRQHGSPPEFAFTVRDHLWLGERLDLLDFETAAVVSGRKFVYLRRAAALLEMGLCSYAMQRVTSHGFVPMMTPDLVRESVLRKCGFQPRAENTQVYSVENSPLCLTGTAEVPLGAVYMDQILSEQQLPMKMAAFGHCFRTEAGAAGSVDRGLYRVHQFSKVEMFVLCTPQQSEGILEELCRIEEEMFQELGLHYKVLDMPTGDLGAPAYRKLDIEAWMPGLQKYGEISSASNCTDYQSRRLNIRYRPTAKEEEASNGSEKPKKPKKVPTEFVHTLNATACAVPRMIVAILENFQREDGTVLIPKVLQPFMGGQSVISPP